MQPLKEFEIAATVLEVNAPQVQCLDLMTLTEGIMLDPMQRVAGKV